MHYYVNVKIAQSRLTIVPYVHVQIFFVPFESAELGATSGKPALHLSSSVSGGSQNWIADSP